MESQDAWQELMGYLESGEEIDAIVFGGWGWGDADSQHHMEKSLDVPLDKRKVLLSATEAEPFMHGWSFYGGYGAPECYAVYVWTNQRVIWVTQYDGSTSLSSAPRNPIACEPSMPGG